MQASEETTSLSNQWPETSPDPPQSDAVPTVVTVVNFTESLDQLLMEESQ